MSSEIFNPPESPHIFCTGLQIVIHLQLNAFKKDETVRDAGRNEQLSAEAPS